MTSTLSTRREAVEAQTKKRGTLPKAATGIAGLDAITGGGLPRGRTTLVCGGPGCGKTLLAAEFLVRGATHFGEPGVFLTFEERAEDLAQNVRSLGFDVDVLVKQKKLLVDYVHIARSEIEETGAYDLDGLFIRLGHAVETIGAKRVVLDSIEALFGGLSDTGTLRAELRRLFQWLKDHGLTAVVTGERGDGSLTRQGLEEYVSDCVILLDHRVTEELSTRRLRIVKYRGTTHGTNEYPFLIDADGFSVLPITSLGLNHEASNERVSTGIPRLDAMLSGGVYRGSSVLVSGTAGTGKTSLAAHFVAAACRRGEKCLYFAFEESQSQLMRNMRSIGIDLEPLVRKGLLQFVATRPTFSGLEMHLTVIHKQVTNFGPSLVVIDPISNFIRAGTTTEATTMLVRLVDFLKDKQITAVLTNLAHGDDELAEGTEVSVSSLIDTWLLLRDVELGGERNRALYILKSRGMAHSNQIREFLLTGTGIELRDVYVGSEGVLTGSMRLAQEARERATALTQQQEIERRQRALERKRKALDAHLAALQAEFEADAEELRQLIGQGEAREERLREDRSEMGRSRGADPSGRAGVGVGAEPGRRGGNGGLRPRK